MPFPIKLSGEVLNTVKAVWAENPVGKTVTEEEYDAFYKHQAGAYDSPMLRLHFRADAPLDLKCLLFVPSYHTEKFGMGRMDPGVSLCVMASTPLLLLLLLLQLRPRAAAAATTTPALLLLLLRLTN